MKYKKDPLPEYGEHWSIKDFCIALSVGMITQDDGNGAFATATEIFTETNCFNLGKIPEGTTHIVWFNK